MIHPDDSTRTLSAAERSRHLGQFRLARLQVVNWGTFSGYKDVPVDERGVLFTGPSGSGKSSLMDAHSTVLLPTHDQRFNASADLTARGAKQATRSIPDYVRGAWSETNDEFEQSKVRYLRGGRSTWSGIAATYADGLGARTTAVVMKWFTGTETDGASMRTMYQLHDGDFDLRAMDEWAQRGFEGRWFKATYPGAYRDSQAAYMRDLTKRIGIGPNKTALALLGKAKAMKNVGDLNLFIRHNMLDDPDTFEAAQKMVASFNPLNDAYETAKRAYKQETILHDLPEFWTKYASFDRERNLAATLLESGAEQYLRGKQIQAINVALDEIDEEIEGLDGKIKTQSDLRDGEYGALQSLENELANEGGELRSLEARLETANARTESREKAYRPYSKLISHLGHQAPEDEEAFTTLNEQIRGDAQRATATLNEMKPRQYEVYAQAVEARKAHREQADELDRLRTARSLIPIQQIERRTVIAHGAGVAVEELPYAAELIDVSPDEERWRPAAEKVLRNMGLQLLVPFRYQDAVRSFIDENDMGGLVEYIIVPRAGVADIARPRESTLAGKLILNVDDATGNWLAGHLATRFSHVCVEKARDLEPHRLAVTVLGTIKMPGSQYRKDDRPQVAQSKNFILGADVAKKRAALENEVKILKEENREAGLRAEEVETDANKLREVVSAGKQLEDYVSWGDVDYWSAAGAAADLEMRIANLKSGNVNLQRLEKAVASAKKQYEALAGTCEHLKDRLSSHDRRQARLVVDLEREESKPHEIDDREHQGYLDDLWSEVEVPITPESMADVRAAFRRQLENRREIAEAQRVFAYSKVKVAIDRFIEEWPGSAADESGDVDRTGRDFAALHAEIVGRRLPEAMTRFEQLISEDMVPSIGVLQRAIENAAAEIESRIKMVNLGLARVEFDAGTHLQIVYRSKPAVESKEFRAKVDELLRDAPGARHEPEKLMRQFRRVRELMTRFTKDETESKRWRINVLDVRNSYEFYGREENKVGETTKTYRNTASNSGGEQEKLVAFCLAAALSYNLANRDSDGRPAFAPLMLDEAFSKSDEAFAQQALAAFDEFGFQLIMAAPIRMSGIVEPFIGQAILVDKRVTDEGARSTAAFATFGELVARRADGYLEGDTDVV